jgi:hypothetical protein
MIEIVEKLERVVNLGVSGIILEQMTQKVVP